MGVPCCKAKKQKNRTADVYIEKQNLTEKPILPEYAFAHKAMAYNKFFKKQITPIEEEEFIDTFFKSYNIDSLILKKELANLEESEKKWFLNLTWKKPHEILPQNYTLYEEIEIDDIRQGELGDCYFLCAVSALARIPSRISHKILINEEKSKNSCYQVKFYLQGKQKIITIDDTFPCHNNIFAFSHTIQNEIWVQVIEKAWAKVNGNYHSTAKGLPSESLSALTPAPVFTYDHSQLSEEELWKELTIAEISKYVICANSSNKSDNIYEQGIVKNHSYSIIGVFNFPNNINLVKLRNPWGAFEWKGDYSDSSPKWTEEMKKATNFKLQQDGIFFMSITDFKNYFVNTVICKYESSYYYNFKKFHIENPFDNVIVKINKVSPEESSDKTKEIYFTLHARQARFYSQKIEGYKPPLSCLYLVKKNHLNGNLEYVASEVTSNDKVILSINKAKITNDYEYYLIANSHWLYGGEFKNNIIISTYSDLNFEISEIGHHEIFYSYQINLMKNYLKTVTEPITVQEKPKQDIQMYTNFNISNKTNYALAMFHNNSKQNYKIMVDAQFDQSKLKFISTPGYDFNIHSKGSDYIIFNSILKPGEDKILILQLLTKKNECVVKISNVTCIQL
jgi:hypothetical protein